MPNTPEAARRATYGAASGVLHVRGMVDVANLTHSYLHQEISAYPYLHPKREPGVRETVASFEKINFALKITSPITLHLGHNDDVRPPETDATVLKALGNPHRTCSPDKNCGHNTDAGWQHKIVALLLRDHLHPLRIRYAIPPSTTVVNSSER